MKVEQIHLNKLTNDFKATGQKQVKHIWPIRKGGDRKQEVKMMVAKKVVEEETVKKQLLSLPGSAKRHDWDQQFEFRAPHNKWAALKCI